LVQNKTQYPILLASD